jgi:multiple sugar transport system permease protein
VTQRAWARAVRWFRRGGLSTLAFAAPMILGFTIFGWWPIIKGVMLSFQETNYISSTWVGLDNFTTVLADPLLAQAFQNTLYFAALAILFGFPVPLILAGTISELKRTRQFASILAFLPVVIPPVVAILLFKRFYSPAETGIINTIVGWVGLGPVEWLQNPATAMASLVFAATWAGMGSTVIIYLAAMTMIDRELYDAAEVDGASILRRIWHVTLPQLRLTILIMLLLQIIGVWQVFTEPYLLTNGGPENRTITILMLIYARFLKGDYGGAAALSLILAVILALLSVVYLRATKKWSSS